jgi:chromate transport protein ChrA
MLYDATLAAAALTVLTTFLVMIFYFKYSRYNDSRLLNTIISLIFTDFMVALLVLVWDILRRIFRESENQLCSVFLHFPIYFFLAGYGWTVIVAFRFLSVSRGVSNSKSATEEQPPVTWKSSLQTMTSVSSWSQRTVHKVVWGGSFVCIAPMIILNSIGGKWNITSVVSTPVSPGQDLS